VRLELDAPLPPAFCDFGFLDPFVPFLEEGCEDDFCRWGRAPCFGGPLVLVLVGRDPREVLVGVDLVAGGDALVVVVRAHDSEMDAIGRETGREICDSGVPGGMLSVNVSLMPPKRFTVITHWSAEAVGRAAIPVTARATAAVTAPTTSFRLLNTVV
jgi:hypothetical protein